MWSPFWEQGSDWHQPTTGPGADQEGAGSLILQSPGELRAPVAFKHNSLIVRGEVRAITEVPRSLPPKVPRVTLTPEIEALVGNEGMRVLTNGIKMHYAAAETNLMDPPPWLDATLYKARTTLFRTNEEGFFPEGGVAPKPSEVVLREHPQPREPPFEEPPDAEHQGEPAERPTEHRGEPAERPAEHPGEPPQRPAENQQNDPPEQMKQGECHGVPAGLEQHELEDICGSQRRADHGGHQPARSHEHSQNLRQPRPRPWLCTTSPSCLL